MNFFELKLRETSSPFVPLRRSRIDTLQVNIGLTCNLECEHCHVASSPRRKEQMSSETMEAILRVVRTERIPTVDITGGAPEMNPQFKEFVTRLRETGTHVMVRTNLTILLEPGYTDFPEFYRDKAIHLVASLPCYLEENVDRQRGDGVYEGSVEVLRRLNALGYGVDPDLELDLVYNPGGPTLPPPQAALEEAYRSELLERFGIVFSRLQAITNMPIGQFLGDLRRTGRDGEYVELLRTSFNPRTIEGLMCRNQMSVDWEGRLYDCDFNLALRERVDASLPQHISDFDGSVLEEGLITTGDHCFGCAAGSGSSCGGALVEAKASFPLPLGEG